MKKIATFCNFLLALGLSTHAQSVYQLSFNFLNAGDSVAYNAFFVNNDNGTAFVRLNQNSPGNGGKMLLEMKLTEEFKEADINCETRNRIYYKSEGIKYINGKDNSINLPTYFCFKLDSITGLFEPFGVSSSSDECKASVTIFNKVEYTEQKDLTSDFVQKYFYKNETFYKNLFETRTKALTVSERNTKLILLVVANSNDAIIGQSCVKDMNRIVESFKDITDFLGIKYVSQTIFDNNYNKSTVEKAISALRPSQNDIVVFYYSGHGFRKPRDNRRAPYIDLRPKNDNTVMENSLNMEDIFNQVKAKGARLNLVLADCCNSLIEKSNSVGDIPARKKGFGMNWSTQNVRDLFMNITPTSILATAAEPGQLATSNNKFGGFFSYFFKTSIEGNFSYFKNNVTWNQVFAETKRQTKWKADHTYCALPENPKNICNQSPYINIR